MKVTDEMVERALDGMGAVGLLKSSETAMRAALESALADEPEPLFVPLARWQEERARIAELEAQLARVEDAANTWVSDAGDLFENDHGIGSGEHDRADVLCECSAAVRAAIDGKG